MTSKILIVEDEEEILELLLAIFEDAGEYQVFCAQDSDQALRTVRNEQPNVVLLDVHLPGMDGYGICKVIKSGTSAYSPKVLMLTGMAQVADFQIAKDVGADGYLTKPFSSMALFQKVNKLLRSDPAND